MPKEPQDPILLTDDDVTAAPPALIRAGIETLPAAITAAPTRENASSSSLLAMGYPS
jgi:hypothetical protein